MRKIIFCMMCLVLAFTLSVGAQEKVKITWAARLDNVERATMWQQWATDYMAAHPNIQIDLVPGGQAYYDNLLTWIAGGQAADVMWMGGDIWRFADHLLPLNQLYAKDAAIREILPHMINAYHWNGKLICLPYGVNTHVFYYNKDILTKHGLVMPAKWTWDDAIKMGKKVTLNLSGNGVPDQFGMYIYVTEWALAYGGNVYTPDMRRVAIDNEATIAGTQLVLDINKGRNPIGFTNAPIYGGAANAINGKIAMGNIGVWEIPKMLDNATFDWDVTVAPALEVNGKQYNATFYSVESWAGYNGTKHPEEVEAFLSYLLSKEKMLQFASLGTVVPTQPRVASQAFMSIKKPQHINAFVEMLNYWKQGTNDHPAYSTLGWYNSGGTWSKIAAGTMPASIGIPELARQINMALDEWFSKN